MDNMVERMSQNELHEFLKQFGELDYYLRGEGKGAVVRYASWNGACTINTMAETPHRARVNLFKKIQDRLWEECNRD